MDTQYILVSLHHKESCKLLICLNITLKVTSNFILLLYILETFKGRYSKKLVLLLFFPKHIVMLLLSAYCRYVLLQAHFLQALLIQTQLECKIILITLSKFMFLFTFFHFTLIICSESGI